MTGLLARAAICLASVLIAGIFALGAAGCLADALYLWLRSLPLTPAVAMLIVGLVLLVVVGIAVLVAIRIVTPGRKPGLPKARGSNAADLGGRMLHEAAAAATAHPQAAAGISLLAGLAVGANPALQALLKAALRVR